MFERFFSKNKKETPIPDAKVAEKRMKAMRENFLNSIRYEPQTAIIGLAKKLVKKETKVENLTDSQLDAMLAYYRNKLNTSC